MPGCLLINVYLRPQIHTYFFINYKLKKRWINYVQRVKSFKKVENFIILFV